MMIGITGGTGAGKTTALKVLSEYGALVIDCDQVYYELLTTDEEMNRELEEEFPEAYEKGVLNRKKLGRIVFADPDRLDALNNIIYKYVIAKIKELSETADVTAVDAISLIESGLYRECDSNVAIIAPKEERIRRIIARDGVSREYAEMRVAAQKPDEFYKKYCDFVLINDSNEEIFRLKCEKLFKEILY